MVIKIDKGIPVVGEKAGRGRKPIYPFAQMQVGDSFFVPKTVGSMSGSVRNAGRKSGFNFLTRSVVENGVSGTRVWRIEGGEE